MHYLEKRRVHFFSSLLPSCSSLAPRQMYRQLKHKTCTDAINAIKKKVYRDEKIITDLLKTRSTDGQRSIRIQSLFFFVINRGSNLNITYNLPRILAYRRKYFAQMYLLSISYKLYGYISWWFCNRLVYVSQQSQTSLHIPKKKSMSTFCISNNLGLKSDGSNKQWNKNIYGPAQPSSHFYGRQ